MHLMHRTFLMLTALLEAATGLLLTILPALPLELLLGATKAALETLLVARIAGAALLAIGIACWLARNDTLSNAHFGLVIGVLTYDVAAVALLSYAALVLGMAGIALWPAVAIHAGLGVWGMLCLVGRPPGP